MSMYCKTVHFKVLLHWATSISSNPAKFLFGQAKWPSNYSRIPYTVNEWSVPNWGGGGGGVKRVYVGRVKDLTLVSLWLPSYKETFLSAPIRRKIIQEFKPTIRVTGLAKALNFMTHQCISSRHLKKLRSAVAR